MELEIKIQKLKDLCSKYETDEFLTFLAGILLQIPTRNENPFFKNLMSPMRQLFFLGFLNLQRNSYENKIGFSEEEWEEMSKLLFEIELEYFYLLGFPRQGKETREEIEKISVTMPTFMNYYFNGPLTYQEQEIERIENIFKDFEGVFISEWNLKISDFIIFYDLLNKEINSNLNKATKFLDPTVWQEFTSKCIDKGLTDPSTWIAEAPEEINSFLNFNRNPGSFLKLNIEQFDFSVISKTSFTKILELFTAEKIVNNDIIYYTEENNLLTHPFLRINETEFLPFYLKQYLDACYNFLFKKCIQIDSDKILKSRDIFVEVKAERIFRKLFKDEAFYYTNYSIDNNTSEQDLLIIYKRNIIVIEVKASNYRAPMRDANKAFDKLKSDFKKNIQYASNQIIRVTNAFKYNDGIEIKDANRKTLFAFNPKKYNNIYSIIVTLERFGHIQTNLSEMLSIDDDNDFPWAVCLDDLEAFILTLIKKKNRVNSFLTFLKYRQNYHGHLICSDELELCGLFLKDEKDFINRSLKEEMIVTLDDLTEPIETAYYNGLGFENERFITKKKDGKTLFLYSKK